MIVDDVHPLHARLAARAESLAKAHVEAGGDVADLFVMLALFVAQESEAIGLRGIEALEEWFSIKSGAVE